PRPPPAPPGTSPRSRADGSGAGPRTVYHRSPGRGRAPGSSRPVRSAGGPTVEGGKGRRGGLGAAAPSTRSDGAAASGPSPEESTGRGPPRTPRRSGGPRSAAAPAAAAATAPGGLGGHPADGHPGQQLHRVVVPLRAAGGIGGLGHRP